MHRFDLFQMTDGKPVWIGTTKTLRHAQTRIQQMALDSTYLFVVLDQTTGRKAVMRSGQNGSH
jgi:hypothetical protein